MEMSAELPCHCDMVYLVQGSHAYESNKVSIGLKVKPSGTDKKEKTSNTIMW